MRIERNDVRVPIVVLLEPAGDNLSYPSKFVPLIRTYLDLSRFLVYAVGSSGLRTSVGREGIIPVEMPIGPVGQRGAYRFLKYTLSLALSSLFLVKAFKVSKARVVVTMAGHCYSGFVATLVSKVMLRKTVLRISEPTRLLLKRNSRPGVVYAASALTERISLTLCDRIFSVRDMSDYCTVDAKKSAVISQGVNLEEIAKCPSEPKDEKKVPLVVNVGRLDSEKNLNVLIESLSILAKSHPALECLLVGWGPESQNLKRLVINASLDHIVKFLGYVPHATVPSILKKCDVFVLPSETEGVPSSILEAMACRVPVIMCLQTGSFADSVRKYGAAFLVDCNPASIASGIECILANERIRKGLQTSGFQYVTEFHDNRISQQRFTQLLMELDYA